ncbi:putative glucan 1,3-beta-glucosidase [Zymoseptoria tritici IPO323]|uniref:glucan endo-1,3-beta-D-glucosidase n=1 Tax=Zymoseptoria tritici (strain CBS 115943 / IPO323) TaxID=336722 RepID=F9XGG9_ZYMTI|nr:putative glucan 1,3-beta-glucosidase [Zymoseptoria tritici IPO323]EGP86269.1 putative glucan 1,3-beta-glucosidase [Zymoseptoria tritici IPO323]
MMRYSASALLALAASVAAQSRGFNYGALDLDGSPRTLQDFTDQFNAAKALPGTNGQFTSARLFTMIQAGSSNNQVIAAIQAAIDTDTSLLLGLWGSGGQEGFNAELGALRSAIEQYGDAFTSRVVGISVGSEDLYRESPTGILNESGVGAGPQTIVSYIDQLRELIAGGPLANAPVGHVDTWPAWTNGSNSAVIEAVDWLGVDAYPYFENTVANGIENGESLFFEALDKTRGVANGKSVWVTETGWPVEGPASGAAQAGTDNAQTYWNNVACRLLDTDTNLWWFTLDDDQATSDDVSFSLVNPSDLTGQPLYDLSCSNASSSSSSASSSVPSTSSSAPSMTSSVESASVDPLPSMSVSSEPSASVDPLPSMSISSEPSSSSVMVSVDPIPGSVSSTLSSFETVPVTTAADAGSRPSDVAGGEGPAVVTSTSVVAAPAPTGEDSSAAPAAQTTGPQTYEGAATRVAGGAAAGLAAVFALFL